ncbi:MAG: hypothetical protein KAI26_02735 [Nanoarchaeota archaeon]|nr:hypothetical protein [Nanoarchaeota archaeon]
MDATQQISKFQEFFEDNYHAEILELIRKGNNFIIVDFVKLLNYDPDLSTFLLDYPDELIKAAEIAIEKFDLPSTMKNFKVRFINLPESQNITISDIRSNHIDKFLVVEGVVRQKSDVRPQVTTARFECPSCGNVISVIQLEKAFKEPNKCGCGRKGKFRLLSKEFVDAQGIVLEEASEDLEGGEQPKRMNVFLSRDLVSPLSEKKTNPGSKIRVAGVLKEVPVELRSGAKATRFDLIIESNSVLAVQEDFYDISISKEEEKRIIELAKDSKCVEKLIQSVAPSIYGYEKIKEALIFQLVGGNRKKRADGAVTRGDMHVLLIGDPGAAKSQLLKRIALVAPKARYVSGKGVSGAGLCVSPDSMILMNNGNLHRIDNLVEKKLKNNNKKYLKGIWQAKNPQSNKKILTLDKHLKIRPKEIDQFWKLKPPEIMVSIKTQSGKEIKTTGHTKLYTIKKGSLKWNEAKDFLKGEYIACARNLKMKNDNTILTLSLINSNPTIYGVKNIVNKMINLLIIKYKTKRNLAKKLNLNENNLYHNWVKEKARGNISLKHLKLLAKESNTSLDKIAKYVTYLSLYKGHKIKIPLYLNEDLLYFAGLIAGDGDLSKGQHTVTIRFSNRSKELLNEFSQLAKKLFDVKCNISSKASEKRPASLRFGSQIVFEIVKALGIPMSPKSNKIDISNILLNLPNNLIAKYISGLFDSDGSVVRKKSAGYIDLTTTSPELVKKLQLVLLRFGISSKIRSRGIGPSNSKIKSKYEKYALEICSKENMEKFREFIDFNFSEKRRKLKNVIDNISKYNTNIDIVPNLQEKIKEIKNTLNASSRSLIGYKSSSVASKNFMPSKTRLDKITTNLKKATNVRIVVERNVIDKIYSELSERMTKKEIAKYLGIKEMQVYDYFQRKARNPKIPLQVIEKIVVYLKNIDIINEIKPSIRNVKRAYDDLNDISLITNSDIMWEKIVDVRFIKDHGYDFVYDLTVNDSHNFLVNGFVVHNTASVVKDEMMGGWALEAGALVLSNKGFCLSGNTKILDSTGRLLSIKEIYDGFKRKKKISIKHFDEKKLRLKDSRVKQVSRRTAQNLLEITFANQDSLKITPEHKIAVWDNGVQWKEAKDLKNSDYAITCLDWKFDRTKVLKQKLYLFELLGLIATDGSLSSKKYVIRYYTKSDYLKSRFKFLVKEVFSKECGEYLDKRSGVWQLYLCSKKHHAAIKDYGIPAGNKSIKKYHLTKILEYPNECIRAFLIGYINGDGCISNKKSGGAIDIVAKNKCTAQEIRDMFRKLGIMAYLHKINASGGGVVKKGSYEQYRITITGIFNFQKIKDKRIAPEKYENLEKILKREDKSFVIPKVDILISQLNKKLQKNDKVCIYRFTKISELKKGRGITRSNLKKILSCLKGVKEAFQSQEFKILTRLVNNYICPVKLKSISELSGETVYNIQVDDAVNQNYFANFLLVHNCMIDEMDKMTPEDRSAMHEALEQQTVSISKANIQATLRCETTVLAAANPKFGRFDPYGIIAEQINLPPALINRFDLIFAIKDIPEIEKDNKIAGHILKLHQDPDLIEPELDTDFLKKYISYVRQKIKPKLTEGAIEELQKYYVEMRNSGTEDGGIKAVPISPRQLEALVRLSEASAKIRLGTKVSRKDAKKGIELLHFSLSEIGIDPETGKIDIDRITTGISSSQRSHIIVVREIINTLEKKLDTKTIPIDDIITEAEIKGIAGDVVEDTIEKLKRSGDIFEPRRGFVQKV